MGIISKSPTIKPMSEPSGDVPRVDVGSGSRPSKSKIDIPTSAPAEPHTLGRAPSGWLK